MTTIKRIATVLIVLSIVLTSTHVFANNQTAVKAKVLNMRTGPGLTYDVIKQLKQNDSIEILATSGEWLQVKHENDKGWVASWLIKSNEKSTNHTVISKVNDLNVRSGPSTGDSVLTRMKKGDEATTLAVTENWTQITVNNKTGWVFNEYLSTSDHEPTKEPATKATHHTFTVAVDALNVRQKPDLSSKNIGLIHKKEEFSILATQDNWVKIELDNKKTGWVYSFHGHINSGQAPDHATASKGNVTILSNGTNIRQKPSTSAKAVLRADAGQQFPIIAIKDDWYEISIPSGKKAYIAKWVVSTNSSHAEETIVKQARVPGTLKGLTIVIDPGHGGNDRGTTGVRGTAEKDMTLPTAEMLATKLKQAGANVQLTRNADKYISLRKRVEISHQQQADAFISIHFDASLDPAIAGFTTYYTSARQQALATSINNQLGQAVSLKNRGAQEGNFFVLRENRQQAVLIELGFLTNAKEERTITSKKFQEQASHAIYNGILQYFND